jgi:alcohol dehydrogenase
MGATTVFAVESAPERIDMVRRMGATHVVDFTRADPV